MLSGWKTETYSNSRARSTKTRIETLNMEGFFIFGIQIHEQDPLKQGLKQRSKNTHTLYEFGFESKKTSQSVTKNGKIKMILSWTHS